MTRSLVLRVATAFVIGQEARPVELAPEGFAGGDGVELAMVWNSHPRVDPGSADNPMEMIDLTRAASGGTP